LSSKVFLAKMDGTNEASQENSSLSPGEKLKIEKLNFGQRIPMSFGYVISLQRDFKILVGNTT
jgi:hypothetical protein